MTRRKRPLSGFLARAAAGCAGFLILAAPPCSAQADPAQAPAAGAVQSQVKIRPKAPADENPLPPDLAVIDAPTSAALGYGGFYSQTRFDAGGGLMQYLDFGVYDGIAIGASLDIDDLIGSGKDIHVRSPNLELKYRFYDGSRYLPSLAVGFDGQGYDYNQAAQQYNQSRRGVYLVASHEIFIPGLEIHPSVNIPDFDTGVPYGALPLTCKIKDKASLMAEWDNIHDFVGSRFNAGLRIYLTSYFDVDIAVRNIGEGGRFSDGQPRGVERVAQLIYYGNF